MENVSRPWYYSLEISATRLRAKLTTKITHPKLCITMVSIFSAPTCCTRKRRSWGGRLHCGEYCRYHYEEGGAAFDGDEVNSRESIVVTMTRLRSALTVCGAIRHEAMRTCRWVSLIVAGAIDSIQLWVIVRVNTVGCALYCEEFKFLRYCRDVQIGHCSVAVSMC